MTDRSAAFRFPGRAFAALLALACLAYGVRGLVAAHYASFTGAERFEGLRTASWLVPENYAWHRDLGDFLTALGDPRAAMVEYRLAIANHALCSSCWMGLAEAQFAAGEDPSEAIVKAVAAAPSTTRTRVRAATLYARLGRDAEAGREFAAAQGGMQKGLHELYALLHRIYDVNFLLANVVGPDRIASYFSYSRQNRPLAETRLVWPRYVAESADKGEGQRVMYAQALLAGGFTHDAWEVMFAKAPRPVGVLLNGGFEGIEEFRPFGWYLKSAEGIEARIETCDGCPEGERALHLSFDGKENPRYSGVWQDLPVEPGRRYVLRAKVRAEHITSASGPRFAVSGRAREGMDANCGMWTPTPDWKLSFDWKEVELAFEAPAACDGIRVAVVRLPSGQLNKFLGGDLWIDDVRLDKVE